MDKRDYVIVGAARKYDFTMPLYVSRNVKNMLCKGDISMQRLVKKVYDTLTDLPPNTNKRPRREVEFRFKDCNLRISIYNNELFVSYINVDRYVATESFRDLKRSAAQ